VIYNGEVAGFFTDKIKKQQIGGGFFWRLTKPKDSDDLEVVIDRYWFEGNPPEGILYFKLFGIRQEFIDAVEGELEVTGDVESNQLASGLEGTIISFDYFKDAIHDRLTLDSGESFDPSKGVKF